MPDLEEYSPQERMQMEKEVTGLYLSGHPMDAYRDSLRRLGVASIGAILGDFSAEGQHRFQDGQSVSVAGVVSSVRTRPTKNKSLMSYVVLEDDSGAMELIVFQKVLDQAGRFLQENAVLFVRGRISARDDKEPQLMAEALLPLEQAIADARRAAEDAREKTLFVKIPSRSDRAMRRLELLLTMFPGREPLVIWCEAERKKLAARCRIHPALIQELRLILGEDSVVVK